MLLNGDLGQMCRQKSALRMAGFIVGQTDIYPTVEESDVERALLFIYINKIDGWWNYESDFINHGICTKEQFWTKMEDS